MDATENNPSALIIYLSLHGTTGKAINALAESLGENGVKSDLYKLSESEDNNDMKQLYKMIPEYELIVFGSPTYFHHAPPLFIEFIEKLPDASSDQAVALLSTFGGVSSGVILFDMAEILYQKKYSLIGAIKVLTEHCLTFQEEQPFCSGHPDENDLEVVKAFGKEITIRLMNKTRRRYSPSDFKDKPFLLNFIDKYINKMEKLAWSMPNVKVTGRLCSGCGLCVRNCPTNNISLYAVATHGKECTYCYSCVRNCPNGAADANLKPAVPLLKRLAKQSGKYEELVTQQVV